MSKSRVIAGAAVIVVLMGITVFSYLERPGGRSASRNNGTALVGDEGNAPSSGMLSTDEFIEFWRKRVQTNPADYISYTELAGGFLRRAREIGDVASYK